jgi:hypothetical protein
MSVARVLAWNEAGRMSPSQKESSNDECENRWIHKEGKDQQKVAAGTLDVWLWLHAYRQTYADDRKSTNCSFE